MIDPELRAWSGSMQTFPLSALVTTQCSGCFDSNAISAFGNSASGSGIWEHEAVVPFLGKSADCRLKRNGDLREYGYVADIAVLQKPNPPVTPFCVSLTFSR